MVSISSALQLGSKYTLNHGWSEPCSYSYHPGPYASDRVILDNSFYNVRGRSRLCLHRLHHLRLLPSEAELVNSTKKANMQSLTQNSILMQLIRLRQSHESSTLHMNVMRKYPMSHQQTPQSNLVLCYQTSPPLVTTEKWYETALRDLGRTMRDSAWMDEKSCGKEDWYCVAGTVAAIEHNNMLGAMVDSQHETGIYSRFTATHTTIISTH